MDIDVTTSCRTYSFVNEGLRYARAGAVDGNMGAVLADGGFVV
jgi:hypothetical protein